MVSSNFEVPIPYPPTADAGEETGVGAVIREVFYSSRGNVCFILEIYRQAFLLPFSHAHAIRKAISVYKDWIQVNVSLSIFWLSFVKLSLNDLRSITNEFFVYRCLKYLLLS